jgi:hypothetical protein
MPAMGGIAVGGAAGAADEAGAVVADMNPSFT